MSAKDCATDGHHRHRRLIRGILACIVSFILVVLIIILILWLVLRPTHPSFILQDCRILSFNLTGDNYLNAIIQPTITSRNPNDRVGVYYDHVDVFAVYKGQHITVATDLPKGYQGHHEVDIWSPFLSGGPVPIASYLVANVQQDANAGFILIYIKLDGKVRWKVGSWMSGHYHLTVSCPAFFACDYRATSFKFQQMVGCNVDV